MIKRIELFATQGTDYKNDWVSLGAPLNGSFERSICKEGYLEFYDIDYSKRTFVCVSDKYEVGAFPLHRNGRYWYLSYSSCGATRIDTLIVM